MPDYGPDGGGIYSRGEWSIWLSAHSNVDIGPMYIWLGYSSMARKIQTISEGVVAIGPSDATYDPEWEAFLGSEGL
jgi:hypothetical protein